MDESIFVKLLRKLEYLYIMNNSLSNLDFLETLQQLNTLDLKNNDIVELKGLPTDKIENLSLSNNKIQVIGPIGIV